MGSVAAVIVAAGVGKRMGTQTVAKQFLRIDGVPILAYTLRKFEACAGIDEIILVARPEDHAACAEIIADLGARKVTALAEGGKERQDSVWNGLCQVNPATDIVLIHDAVRMFVTEEMLTASIQAARECGASIVAVPAKDTIKKATGQGESMFVETTLDRNTLWQVQTPQTFQYRLIVKLHQHARELGIYGTDDAMLAEHFGHPVKIVPGSYRNIKITTPDDLVIATAFVRDECEIPY
jgi:2-C-methyl-D-erythritol 4-phosphate cytidylyltransferase